MGPPNGAFEGVVDLMADHDLIIEPAVQLAERDMIVGWAIKHGCLGTLDREGEDD